MKQLLLLVIALTLACLTAARPVIAQGFLDFTQNDIQTYDPRVACSSVSGPGKSILDGHELPATSGKTGTEKEINRDGVVTSGPDTGNHVSFFNHANGIASQYGDDALNYYITMRWNYVSWYWNGTSTDLNSGEFQWMKEAPRKVLVTNSRTGKSIIAVALEAGPAPWTGVDTQPNNNPKQGWANPQRGTPLGYTGRVSGFPQKALQALGATQGMADGSGDVLQYSWAPDQNAAPGPTEVTSANQNSDASCATGAAQVNAEGYAFPIGLTKADVNNGYNWPCATNCHHDNTPAFDLAHNDTVKNNDDAKTVGVPVYAIFDGKVQGIGDAHRGIAGCYEFQLVGNDGWQYWYGHIAGVPVQEGQAVTAGQEIARVGQRKCTANGSYPHLHIDRGSPKGKVGGLACCRDQSMVPLMNSLYDALQ